MRADGRKGGRWMVPANWAEMEQARWALQQLKDERLRFSYPPAPEKRTHNGQKLRIVSGRNPPWYSAMAQRRGYARRDGPMNRRGYGSLRKKVTAALERICSGWKDPIGLEEEILDEFGEYMDDLYRGKHD